MSSGTGRTVIRVAGGASAVTLVGGGLAVGAQSASAATFTVDSEAELVQAINDANGTVGVPDTIDIDAGTITLTAALPTITDELTISGAGEAATIIDGAAAFRAFYASSAGTLALDNLTIQNGYVGAGMSGGAVKVTSTSLTLTSVTFSDNKAYAYGGAVEVYGTSEDDLTVSVTDSTFSDNTALYYDGGAIDVRGHALEVTITGSTFERNTAVYAYAGAVAIWDQDATTGVTLTITDSTFSYNEAYGGAGAVYVDAYAGSVAIDGSTFTKNYAYHGGAGGVKIEGYMTVDVSDSTFYANETYGGDGGGLYLRVVVSATVEGTEFVGNRADGTGGAIEAYRVADLTVSDSTFRNNSATDAGAIFFDISADPEGYLTIQNSTFDQNQAQNRGGAISASSTAATLIEQSTFSGNTAGYTGAIDLYWNYNNNETPDNQATATIRNSTIVGNTATISGSGGVYAKSTDGTTLTIVNTIIADNVGAVAPVITRTGVQSVSQDDLAIDMPTGTVTIDHSLINSTATDVEGSGVGNIVGADPLLGALGDNGGLTETMEPDDASPVVDAGDSAVAPFDTDQRGATRVQGDAIDIGAVETPAEAVTTTTIAPTTTVAPETTEAPGTTVVPTTQGPTTTLGPAVLPPTGGGARTGVLAAMLTGLGVVLTLGATRRRRTD